MRLPDPAHVHRQHKRDMRRMCLWVCGVAVIALLKTKASSQRTAQRGAITRILVAITTCIISQRRRRRGGSWRFANNQPS